MYEEKCVESDGMYLEKGKKVERYIFDSLYQHVSTSLFCLNTKIFYQNYFGVRNNHDL